MPLTSRRAFVQQACSLAALASTQALPASATASARGGMGSIIDGHIHLYDPTRPGGVPWPEPSDAVLYRPALPGRYRAIAAPLGVVGAIAIECSPRNADNDWLLQTAAADPIMVGVVGDLDPAVDSFPRELERLAGNALFRGIRYGNLWNRNLGEALGQPGFISHLKLVGEMGLVLETANPNPELIADLVVLTDRAPALRLVIDHLPQAPPPPEAEQGKRYRAQLATLSERAQVYVKGSEVFRRVDGKVVHDAGFYKGWLDEIWGWFGEDRLFYGSDWPNSDHLATYGETLALIEHYVRSKGQGARHKFFAANSRAVYGWKARTEAQEQLAPGAPERSVRGDQGR